MIATLQACLLVGNRLQLRDCGLNVSVTEHCIVSNAQDDRHVSAAFRYFGQTIELCPVSLFPTAIEHQKCMETIHHSRLNLIVGKQIYALDINITPERNATFEERENKVVVHTDPQSSLENVTMELTCRAANASRVLLLEKYEELADGRTELLFGCNYFIGHANDEVDEIAQETREKVSEFQYNLAKQCNEEGTEPVYCDLSAKRYGDDGVSQEFTIFGIPNRNVL